MVFANNRFVFVPYVILMVYYGVLFLTAEAAGLFYIFKKGTKKYARICALDIKLFAKLIKSTKNICNFVYD